MALAALFDDPAYLERAGRYLSRMRAQASQSPLGFAHLWLAADAFLDGAAEVTLVGQNLEELLTAVNQTFAPTVAVRAQGAAVWAKPARTSVNAQPAAYLCRRFSCLPPITDPGELRAALSH